MASVRIDASGNIVPASPPPEQQQRMPLQGGRLRSLTDAAPPATAPRPLNPLQKLRASVAFNWRGALGLLIALQVAAFLASCWLVPPRRALQPTTQALWKLGSSNAVMERCAVVAGGKFLWELRRPVVAMFLHTGVPHILMNLLFQVLCGPTALEKYGPRAFMCLFLVSGICGNLLSDAFEHNGVGASTACYGLIGAFLAQLCLAWGDLDAQQRWLAKVTVLANGLCLVLWEVLQWDTLGHFGHLGGFLSGAALGFLLAADAPGLSRALCGAGLALSAALFAAKVFLLGPPGVDRLFCEAQWQLYSS